MIRRCDNSLTQYDLHRFQHQIAAEFDQNAGDIDKEVNTMAQGWNYHVILVLVALMVAYFYLYGGWVTGGH